MSRLLPALLSLGTILASCGGDALLTEKGATGPAVRLTPSSLVFDADGPDSAVVTIESVGSGDLSVSEVALSLEDAFTVTIPGGNVPGVLVPGTSAELVVTWDGSEAEDELQVVSDDPTLPVARVDLLGLVDGGEDSGGADSGDSGDTGETDDTGEVGLPGLALSPTSADVGTVALGSAVTETFTVESTGTADASLTAASVSGAGFSLDTALTFPYALAVGDTVDLVVRFEPEAAGAASGMLLVEGVDVASVSATLQGTGELVDPRQEFTWSGSAQSYVVPAGVTSVTIKAWGAGGGAGNESGAASGTGGGGGYAETTVSVTPGEVLTVRPGQGGIAPGGGGGASMVQRADGTLLAVAGGGGGGGTDGGSGSGGPGTGGAAGGTTGTTGASMSSSTWGAGGGGTGGSQTTGGQGGSGARVSGSGNPCDGADGAHLQGGGGAYGSSSCSTSSGAVEDTAGTGSSNGAGGGGGAGYYGGGGGGSLSTYYGGGGGGGSSYALSGSVVAGSGDTAANTSDTDYDGTAGTGGQPGDWPHTTSTDGEPGRVVIQ
mgnify:CR=1 FL=1